MVTFTLISTDFALNDGKALDISKRQQHRGRIGRLPVLGNLPRFVLQGKPSHSSDIYISAHTRNLATLNATSCFFPSNGVMV